MDISYFTEAGIFFIFISWIISCIFDVMPILAIEYKVGFKY